MMFFLAAIILGITGSMHCIGMCGPIALALPTGGRTGLRRLAMVLSYNFGRASSYALLGALAGTAGFTIALSSSQQWLSVFAGLVLIVAALAPLAQKPLASRIPVLNSVGSRLARSLRERGNTDLFSIGMLNGLLPCGLVYMALAIALAGGGPVTGAAYMFLFGLGTIPAMAALPLLRNRLSERVRKPLRLASPLVMTALGVLLFLRGLDLGIPYISPAVSKQDSSCHNTAITDHCKSSILCTGQN